MNPQSPWLDLFNSPEPVKVFNLNAQDFKSFVQYAFERAGYHVEPYTNPGADLILSFDGKALGYIACSSGVKHVGPGPVLALNGIPVGSKIPKFYVSSDGFTTQAIGAENSAKYLYLLDFTKLRRFMSYVKGTRHPSSKNVPLSPEKLFDDEPQKRNIHQTKVMTLANNKGGACKTTSAFAIGYILATEMKKRVLFVDMDDQANLTQVALKEASLRSRKYIEPNISHYFANANEFPLSSLIMPTDIPNAWLIPSDPELRLTLSNVVDWTETEQQFIRGLHHSSVKTLADEDFDWIILDTPPSLGLYTRAATLASHYVLTPYTPNPLDYVGMENLLDMLQEVSCIADSANETKMLGCFTTRWRRSRATSEDVGRIRDIALSRGVSLFDTDIDEDATNIRKLILQVGAINLSRVHGAIDDYRNLVKEIQHNVGDN